MSFERFCLCETSYNSDTKIKHTHRKHHHTRGTGACCSVTTGLGEPGASRDGKISSWLRTGAAPSPLRAWSCPHGGGKPPENQPHAASTRARARKGTGGSGGSQRTRAAHCQVPPGAVTVTMGVRSRESSRPTGKLAFLPSALVQDKRSRASISSSPPLV